LRRLEFPYLLNITRVVAADSRSSGLRKNKYHRVDFVVLSSCLDIADPLNRAEENSDS
jgi:hypothetical protein